VNLFGYDFYKECYRRRRETRRRARPRARVLPPRCRDNVERLRNFRAIDEVSFHMSGTEAVMQAVRLALSHAPLPSRALLRRLPRLVGRRAAGLGNRRRIKTYTLDGHERARLHVLRDAPRHRLRAREPAAGAASERVAPADSTLVDGARRAQFDRAAYPQWLKRLREVCTRRDIVLIFDEVFIGFRLGRGGAQEYFGVRADLVTYGKTLGGGLPSASSAARIGHETLPRRPAERRLFRARHVQLAPVRHGCDERIPTTARK
jgi:glutamate-1-semialdehyde 2,1-aminomutase